MTAHMRSDGCGGSASTVLFLLIFSFFCGSARADTLDDLFHAAVQKSAAGDEEAALVLYGRLIEAGVDDADVYYDAGRANAKLGRLGHAIYFYEKALAVRPDDEEASRALRSVTALVSRIRARREGDRAAQDPGSAAESAVRGLGEPTLAGLILMLAACFFGSLAALHVVRGEMGRLVAGVSAAVIGIALGVASLGLAAKRGAFRDGASAVIVEDDVMLRDAPDPRAGEVGSLYDGDRVSVVAREGRWVRVRGRGRDGWIPQRYAAEL